MKIKNLNCSVTNSKVKLSAQLILENKKTHDIFFEIGREYKDFVASDASPFLPAALSIAMKKHESLEIDGSISECLHGNTLDIMKILESWHVGFSQISIKIGSLKKDKQKARKIGCFFSGGADSFYTYLKNKNKITHLIFVHGFDINVNDIVLYNKMEKNIIKIAGKEKIKLIRVKTNIREIFEQYYDWNMSHEFALASVALFIRGGLKEIFASCGLPDMKSSHRYMNPDLDCLWSTERMKINHYGCKADKIAKLKFLSNNKLVMENLRVCWRNTNKEYNCCECEKCFRNMLALYVSDSLEKCKTFKKRINLDTLQNTRIDDSNLKYFMAILEVLRLKNDNSEVRFALEECIKNNKFPKFQQRLYRNTRNVLRYFDNKYNRNRLFWSLSKRGLIS